MTERRIPVTVLTGFLGAGKTTVLNHLLRQPELAGAAVLVNEFGRVAVDHQLVEKIDEGLVLLDSGCLCCSVHGDLVRALRGLFSRALRRQIRGLRRVVIETTGLADVAPVIHTLQADFFLAERYRLDGVATVVDACHIERQLIAQREAAGQVALADVLLVSKLDLTDDGGAERVRQLLRRVNPTATVLAAAHGAVPADAVLGAGAQAQRPAPRFIPAPPSGQHRHGDGVQAFSLQLLEPVSWGAFAAACERLQQAHGDALLRMKGVLRVRGQEAPQVVHGVHHQLYPAQPLAAAEPGTLGQLVFIVRDLEPAAVAEAFRGLLAAPA